MHSAILKNILTLHAGRYPEMEARDYVKLLYQSEFGPGHLLSDPDAALEPLQQEFALAVEESYAPPYTVEAIGGGLCRFHLDKRRLSEEDLPLLLRCFALSARSRGSLAGLNEKLGLLAALAWRKELPVGSAELESWLALYLARECPSLHHSDTYREAYHPHYRVMDRDLALYFPALQTIDAALRDSGGPVIAAVDGRCGAGKTTFAARCAQVFDDCQVIHMDDYFLPPEKRTPERLSAPGGNVDYERAAEELLAPLSRGEAGICRAFRCSDNTFSDPAGIPCARLTVLEGTYALHPALANYARVHIFLTCDPDVQLSRLERRESPESLENFRTRWIPLEEAYFSGLSIPDQCDVTVDTSRLPTKEESL